MKNISLLLMASFILLSCSSDIGKILRNEKMTSTDEFLVKKKEPLVLPPDYNKIPEPGSLNKDTKNDDDRIKKILRTQEKKSSKKSNATSIEDSIIDRIRK